MKPTNLKDKEEYEKTEVYVRWAVMIVIAVALINALEWILTF